MKRCRDCEYVLDRLPSNRCPECGRRFDPDDPGTYGPVMPWGRGYLGAALGGVVAIGVAAAGLRWADRTSSDALQVVSSVMLFSAYFVEVGVCIGTASALRRAPRPSRLARTLYGAFAISFAVVVLGIIAMPSS